MNERDRDGLLRLQPIYDDRPPAATIIPHAPTRPTKPTPASGRFLMLNQFVDQTMATLQPSEALVWLCLFRHARDGRVRVSQTRIAAQCGISTCTAKRAVASLIKRKLLRRVVRGTVNHGCSEYKIRAAVPLSHTGHR